MHVLVFATPMLAAFPSDQGSQEFDLPVAGLVSGTPAYWLTVHQALHFSLHSLCSERCR